MNDPERESLVLPRDFSLGSVTVYVNNELEPCEVLDAIGTICVPKGAELHLTLGQAICEDLHLIHLVPGSLLSNGINILQKRLSHADFSELRLVKGLRSLSIAFCDVLRVEQLVQLGHLFTLEHLTISDTRLDSKEFSWIRQLPNLKTLTLSGVGADSTCVESIRGLEHLYQLDLGRANLSDADVCTLWQRQTLNTVGLDRCGICDDALKQIGQSDSLQNLRVSGNRISDYGIKMIVTAFQNREQLRFLELSSCSISDRSLVYLASLVSLRQIGLYETGVTRDGVSFLQRSLGCCRIVVEASKR